MGVAWEGSVPVPLEEGFVWRSVAPVLPWGIFESCQVTDDKEEEWPPAAVANWAAVSRDLWLESVRCGFESQLFL